jgi:hypothetical protein
MNDSNGNGGSGRGGNDRRDLRAASWWNATLGARWSRPVAMAGAGLVLSSGCAGVLSETQDDDGQAALDEQQQNGWNVGSEDAALTFRGAQQVDVAGSPAWRDAMTTLALRLSPALARWAPYYNPTLFQSLETPRSAGLRALMLPVFTPEMALASRRGEALLSLLIQDGVCRNDVAVVLDLPGPESVAVAAALAPCFDPVFVLDNWPHPLGVVPAHLTLGAALYFLPTFERARAYKLRAPAAVAPVFVLDQQRLAPYTDDAGQFDNRYVVGLPPHEALQAAGIHHLLYVTGDDRARFESDDLNNDLVAIDGSGVDVKMLALSDFSERPLPDWPSDPGCVPAPLGPPPPAPAAGAPLYFGGSPASHSCFSFWYGWQQQIQLPYPGYAAGVPAPPPRLAPRCRFRPLPRPTFVVGPGVPGQTGGIWHGSPGGTVWRGHPAGEAWRGTPPGAGGPGNITRQTSGLGFGFGRSGSFGRAHGGFSG